MAIAKESRRRPSEIAGITCSFCAYCFDETLFARLWALQDEQLDIDRAEAAIDRNHDLMMEGAT